MDGLLLLDVDGVLNPYAASRNWLDRSDYRRSMITVDNGMTYPVWLDRTHGQQLLDLASETGLGLVWCTTWEDEANERIAHRIGLPELPVIRFGFNAVRWKFNAALDYAAGRPLAWLDDDFQLHHEHRDWFLAQRGPVSTLLRHVDPHVGLVSADFDAVRQWATTL
jgi:Swiss Army Knife RNA repair-like protein